MAGFLTRLILRSKLREQPKGLRPKFMSWEQVQKLALIIPASTDINKSAVDKFVSETKKFVEVFYVETRSKQASYGDWICLLRKDKSVFDLPKKNVETQLRGRKYDLVINTGPEDDLFSAAVLRFLSAPFKCAAGSFMQDANLVVKRPDNTSLVGYLNETLRYLQMIKVA